MSQEGKSQLPVEQPDDTAHFAAMRHEIDPEIRKRVIIERAVVRRAIQGLLDAGYEVALFDGEDMAVGYCTDLALLMRELMACDEERLYARHRERACARGSVLLVYGNDGWDVLADYSTNLEGPLKGANEYADQLAELLS